MRLKFRYGLRMALIAVALVGSSFAWLHHRTEQLSEQDAAVAAIRAREGIVLYDYEVDAWHLGQQTRNIPPGPRILTAILGDHFFASVHSVIFLGESFERTNMDDADLKFLEPFSDLRRLALSNSRISDRGLERLATHHKLEELDLSATDISDAGLVLIGRLRRLKKLNLVRTNISDEGLKHLEPLTELRQLELMESHVTANGVARLRVAMPSLKNVVAD
jgi:hypothetical protein